LPKLASMFSLKFYWSKTLVTALCLVSAFLLTDTFGQNKNQERDKQAEKVLGASKTFLPEKVGEVWRAIGAPHTLNADHFSDLPDGDVYTEYGLETLTTRFYTDGKAKIAVELFQTHFASEAYGLFTFIRGYSDEKRWSFYAGPLVVSISGETEDTKLLQPFIGSLKRSIVSEEGELPSLPFNLPEGSKARDTEKYVIGPTALGKVKEFADLKGIVNFAGGTHAVVANYQNAGEYMSLIIFEYHTPQLATDGYAQFQNYLERVPLPEKNTRLLRRIGNYIVLASNVRDVRAAETIISQIKYSPKIYWEGTKLSNVPIQFRPPDPIAIEEASQTANMIIRTFYWIGVMIFVAILIGFIAGSSLFYWNRYRRQRLGIDDVFGDTSGTVRLNLDDYLIEAKEYSVKRIAESGKEKG